MNALLERFNASRRFARSVYAPHKLALRQGVPSALRAVGVTAPAPQVLSVARSVAPRALRAAAPVEARGDAAPTLEPQGLAHLEPQQKAALLAVAAPLESVPLESMQEASLEDAASADLAPSEPTASPESSGAVAVEAPMPLEPPVARADLSQARAAPEPSAEAVAPAMRVAEAPMPTTVIGAPEPAANPSARAFTTPLGSVGEMLVLVQADTRSEPEGAEAAPPVLETQAIQPSVTVEPARFEPQVAVPDLEVIEAALIVQDAVTLAPAPLAPAPLAPATLELTAPIAADQPVPSPDAIQPPARGRVIEEFQARPPRNMPPRNQPPRAAELEPMIEAAVNEAPRRSPEEWARLLRQRFAQPGDETFDEAVTPAAPAVLEVARLEIASSHSSPPTLSPEPRANTVAPPLEGQAAITDDSSAAVSALEIRERSLAALQAIPEDMTKRSPRDWGLALIRRYASLDEANAIGIEAYRDPNDPAAMQTPPSEPAQSLAPRATVLGSVSSSPALSRTASSSAEQALPSGLEVTAHPAMRFVAPRIVNSTVPAMGTFAPSETTPVQAGAVPAQPASQQRSALSRASLEQSNNALEVAPQIPSPLGRQAPAVDAPLQPTLETGDSTTLQTDGASVDVNDAQMTRAALSERPASNIVQSTDVAPSDAPQSAAANLEPLNLEPVRLSGATRRFLEPLVGFDPNEVGVYTGEGATRLTRDLHADAAAQDGMVLLPDASNLETPAQLGLLAHELIHAAQQQQSAPAPQPDASLEPTRESPVRSALESTRPFEAASRRFVPAVGSSDTRSAASSSSAGPHNAAQFSNAVRQSSAPINQGIASFASEEDRSRTAEARVTQIARAGPLSSVPASAEPSSADPTNALASWNGLPAPWESLPDLESLDLSPSDDGVISLIGAGLSPQGWGGSATTTNPAGYGGSVSSSSTGTSSGSASNAAQAAEIGRELPAEASGAAAAAPDLEQLAKQVYDVLKRRLQSDRRRSGV